MANNKLESNRFYDLDEVNRNNPITISGNGQNSSKSQIVLFIVIFSFLVIISTSLALYFTPKNSYNTRLNNDNKKPTISDSYRNGSSNIPKVINVPSSYGYVDEGYFFVPRILDSDTPKNEIIITFTSGPDWLNFADGEFTGIPTVASTAAEKVEYTISDGKNMTEYDFYIFIYPARLEEVE